MFIPERRISGEKEAATGDKPLKSIVKSITWRIVGTADTILISYILTGKVYVALSIGSVELFSKMLLYYLHERAWAYISWKKITTFFVNSYRRIARLVKAVFALRSLINQSDYVPENH